MKIFIYKLLMQLICIICCGVLISPPVHAANKSKKLSVETKIHRYMWTLKNFDASVKMGATQRILADPDFSDVDKIELLIKALDYELEESENRGTVGDSELHSLQILENLYVSSFKTLFKSNPDLIDKKYLIIDKKSYDKLAIVLYSVGEKSLLPHVLKIINTSSNQNDRVLAVETLIQSRDRSTIPLLKRLLKDNYNYLEQSDVVMPDYMQTLDKYVYPIQEAARDALLQMGMDVQGESPHFFVVD